MRRDGECRQLLEDMLFVAVIERVAGIGASVADNPGELCALLNGLECQPSGQHPLARGPILPVYEDVRPVWLKQSHYITAGLSLRKSGNSAPAS